MVNENHRVIRLTDTLARGLELVPHPLSPTRLVPRFIQDHPYQRRFLDTTSLNTDLAARTSRVRFFPDVAKPSASASFDKAKAAASIDRMSAGRFELGLVAGGFWDAIEAMGGPRGHRSGRVGGRDD